MQACLLPCLNRAGLVYRQSAMSIRVVLVGDDDVGKTSLVSCVVSDTFQEKDPVPVLPEVAAPADLLISPGRSVTLVDTSNRPASRIAFQQVIPLHLVHDMLYGDDFAWAWRCMLPSSSLIVLSALTSVQEIRAADCILVVYDASDEQALLRVHARWMGLIKVHHVQMLCSTGGRN